MVRDPNAQACEPQPLVLKWAPRVVGADAGLSHVTVVCRHFGEPLEPTGKPRCFECLKVLVAVAGGVNAHNPADYAHADADILLTSPLCWAAPSDVKVLFGS